MLTWWEETYTEMSPMDTAWLVGLLEGEGCFYINRKAPGKICVKVSMADIDIVHRACSLMRATRVRSYKPTRERDKKTMHEASITGWKAAGLVSWLHPHLGKRRASKVSEMLAGWRSIAWKSFQKSPVCARGHNKSVVGVYGQGQCRKCHAEATERRRHAS